VISVKCTCGRVRTEQSFYTMGRCSCGLKVFVRPRVQLSHVVKRVRPLVRYVPLAKGKGHRSMRGRSCRPVARIRATMPSGVHDKRAVDPLDWLIACEEAGLPVNCLSI
jgi:hypothetical protein